MVKSTVWAHIRLLHLVVVTLSLFTYLFMPHHVKQGQNYPHFKKGRLGLPWWRSG